MATEKLLLRVSEAADLVSVSRAQAYLLIQRGELPSIRLGRSVRVPAEGLRAYVRRLTAESRAEGGGA